MGAFAYNTIRLLPQLVTDSTFNHYLLEKEKREKLSGYNGGKAAVTENQREESGSQGRCQRVGLMKKTHYIELGL